MSHFKLYLGRGGHVFRWRDRTGSVHVATRRGLQTGGMISEEAGEEGEVFTSMQTHLSQPCRCVRTNHVMWVNGASCRNPAGHTASSRHNLDSHVQTCERLTDRQTPRCVITKIDTAAKAMRRPHASEVAVARPRGLGIFHTLWQF